MEVFNDLFLENCDNEIRQIILDAIDAFQVAKNDRSLFMELDLPVELAPAALVGREIRHYWPDDDTWYPGTVLSYDPSTAKHLIKYSDGTSDDIFVAIERLRVLVPLTPHEHESKPTSEQLITYRETLLSSCSKMDLEKAGITIDKVTHRAAQLTAPRPPPPPPRVSYKYGDTVWGKVNGFPHWPAIVVTREHILQGACCDHGKHVDSIPVCYFGTYEYQLVKPSNVTSIHQGAMMNFHAQKSIKKKEFAVSIRELIEYLKV